MNAPLVNGAYPTEVSYEWAGNIGGLLARTVKAGRRDNTTVDDAHYYYHYDGSGAVGQLDDSAQQIIARYAHEACNSTRTLVRFNRTCYAPS